MSQYPCPVGTEFLDRKAVPKTGGRLEEHLWDKGVGPGQHVMLILGVREAHSMPRVRPEQLEKYTVVLPEHCGDVALVDLERTSIHLASKNIIIVSLSMEGDKVPLEVPFCTTLNPNMHDKSQLRDLLERDPVILVKDVYHVVWRCALAKIDHAPDWKRLSLTRGVIT